MSEPSSGTSGGSDDKDFIDDFGNETGTKYVFTGGFLGSDEEDDDGFVAPGTLAEAVAPGDAEGNTPFDHRGQSKLFTTEKAKRIAESTLEREKWSSLVEEFDEKGQVAAGDTGEREEDCESTTEREKESSLVEEEFVVEEFDEEVQVPGGDTGGNIPVDRRDQFHQFFTTEEAKRIVESTFEREKRSSLVKEEFDEEGQVAAGDAGGNIPVDRRGQFHQFFVTEKKAKRITENATEREKRSSLVEEEFDEEGQVSAGDAGGTDLDELEIEVENILESQNNSLTIKLIG
ncbi:hypothetical protein SEMRO_2968_G341160.1 [Seminavis robusta]|uniref:Uncharacterized protein n=1 Tax=Seminavis robusta TaxID=568900 RepID=A0A9N8F4R0_9STRA|nr:hypothetical protein SEMRO_2968_G341160.1 [Seminavis robusta]|eukprot:Sro2968_g341160.1 n/a (289) ;mRNA; f:255-1279